jgi:hypothetical protein
MRARSVKFFSQPYPQIFDGGFLPSRDVAQPGRALAWGARGRQFKSARPDHFLNQQVTDGCPNPAWDLTPRLWGAVVALLTRFEPFFKERKFLVNVSPATFLGIPITWGGCSQNPRPRMNLDSTHTRGGA